MALHYSRCLSSARHQPFKVSPASTVSPSKLTSNLNCLLRTDHILKELREASYHEIASHSQKFFKTGKGE